MPFAGFLINRVQMAPDEIPDRSKFPTTGPAANWDELCNFVARAPKQQAQLAMLHAQHISTIQNAGPKDAPLWTIPDRGQPVNAMDDLIALGVHLPSGTELL